jgi:hypothetical protein
VGHGHNLAFIIGAGLSAAAAALHIGVIIAGPRWYRLFGAGNRFVRAAQSGRIYPAVVTAAISLVLFCWAAYALSGAGVIGQLPLLRPALCAITLVYLLRGIAGPLALAGTGRSTQFIVVSSAVCLAFGLIHLLGLIQTWDALASSSV